MVKKITTNRFLGQWRMLWQYYQFPISQNLKMDDIAPVDLDEHIGAKYRALDESNAPDIHEKIIELKKMKESTPELVVVSSFHPSVVKKWKNDNADIIGSLLNDTILQLPREFDLGRPDCNPENPRNFVETPAMEECPSLGCNSTPGLMDSVRKYIKENKFKNDLEEFFFTAHHRRSDRYVHYFDAYDRYFSKFRGSDTGVLEIGTTAGGGLQMWKNYFGKEASIYGIDIRPAAMFEEEQIRCFLGDQEDQDFLDRVIKKIPKLDLIIDDGGHSMKQQIGSFIKLWPHLKPGGIYLVEDLATSYHPQFRYGNEDPDKTFVAVAKRLIDEINRDFVEYAFAGRGGAEAVGAGCPEAKEAACIHAHPGMVFIEKLPEVHNRRGWPGENVTRGHAVQGLPAFDCQLACRDGS